MEFMSTKTVTVEEAEKRLTELIGLAQQGDEIVIAEDNQPKAKLVPVLQKAGKRVFGQHRGKIHIAENFNDPLPDDFWLGGNP